MRFTSKNLRKGNATVGLLVITFFVLSLVLFNSPNLLLTNMVAYATTSGTIVVGGGGGSSAGPYSVQTTTTTSTIDVSSHVAVLNGAATASMFDLKLLTASELAAERSEVTAQVSNITSAISALSSAGVVGTYKDLAVSAVRQTLLRLIRHTINHITNRIAVLAAQ